MADEFVAIENPPLDEVLLHYGILGMKWGVRRYQNPDGSLTPAGLERQRKKEQRSEKINAVKESIRAKKEQRKKARAANERRRIWENPRLLEKHMRDFSAEEIDAALRFYDQRNKLHYANTTKIGTAKRYVDTILSYGDAVNNGLRFLNSDVGRALRGKLGLSTEKWADFSAQDKRKQRALEYELDQQYPKNKGKNKNKDSNGGGGGNRGNGGNQSNNSGIDTDELYDIVGEAVEDMLEKRGILE